MRESKITRDEAFELLKKYNKDPFHDIFRKTSGTMKFAL